MAEIILVEKEPTIIKNYEIVNWEELLKDAEWKDHPNDGDSICFSVRRVDATLDGIEVELLQSLRCSSPRGDIRVQTKKPYKTLHKHKIEVSYSRNPHTGEWIIKP